jgi:hypothetical protein
MTGGGAASDAETREGLINALLTWGGQQEERRLALATKLKWESHDSSGLDTSHLTDHQKEERLAYERCGFIFAMYHADTWWCEIWDLVRPLFPSTMLCYPLRFSSLTAFGLRRGYTLHRRVSWC